MSNAVKKVTQESAEQPVEQFQPNRRILVVEDEPEIAKLYSEILGARPAGVVPIRSSRQAAAAAAGSSAGAAPEFEVTVCHSAEDALLTVRKALAKNESFAMGFFDVLLGPGMDGIALVKEIHETDPTMFAVFVTAYHDRSVDSIRAFLGESREGHWDYLNKPFEGGEILQKARNFVSLWNLTKEKSIRDHQLADAHRRLLEYERTSSVAAVARGVSHEFGNILMQIMGKAELGRNKSEEQMRETLDRILDASQRAAEILDKFKNLSGSSEDAVKQNVLVSDLIDEALDLMEHPLKTNRVKACKIKMDKVKIKANSTAILQVFVNLIINAIHAMGDSGQLDFSVLETGRGVEIRFRDYGPGIKPELMEKVLEPFFTTKGDKGTGLGLSICREIVEVDHRGEFKLQNHPVKGLEVIMRLPADPDKEGEAA